MGRLKMSELLESVIIELKLKGVQVQNLDKCEKTLTNFIQYRLNTVFTTITQTCQVNPNTAGFTSTNFLCTFCEFSLAAIANIWRRVIHCIDQRIIARLSF